MICKGLSREKCNRLYQEVLDDKDCKAQRQLVLSDLFYLLTIGCKRRDINHPWLFDRCREVEADPDGHLDLWAREHYKSTIITYGKSIQDIFNDQNITIGIFSHTRPIAKAFLDQIKTELEINTYFQGLFPEILYKKPKTQSVKWSLDDGIKVKRTDNNKEPTVSAWGLVDGQPTSKHFKLLVYDDVVTKDSVTTPEQIKKTTSSLEMSYNLGAHGGAKRFIGTRYHANDTYRTIIDRGTVTPRIKPATDNGKMDGEPVFLSKEELVEKRRDQGPYTFGSQMLQNPVADKAMGFKKEWLRFYDNIVWDKWNRYILVDPASEKKKTSDYTVIKVIGLAQDNNYYLIDAVRDRMNLSERTSKVFEFHRKYKPLKVGYEKYGKDSDIEHIKYVQEQNNYRFDITELGGITSKSDRIKKLIPVFDQKRMWLPKSLSFVDYEGRSRDYVKLFVDDEYDTFPVCVHDDMLDCMARIVDPMLNAEFPKEAKPQPKQQAVHRGPTGWMG